MTRGYFGWQRANNLEERRFERELAKRAREYLPDGTDIDEADVDTSMVPLPWIATDDPDQSTQPG